VVIFKSPKWTQLTTPGLRIVVVALRAPGLTGVGPDGLDTCTPWALAADVLVTNIAAATTANARRYIAFGFIFLTPFYFRLLGKKMSCYFHPTSVFCGEYSR
jgi:hypothetical protein